MKKCIFFWYLSYFQVLCLTESKGQRGYCPQDKPVIRFCTDAKLTNLTDINIDTSSVPKYQVTVCECSVISYVHATRYMFSYYDRVVPRNMIFKINDALISSVKNTYIWNTDKGKLLLLTSRNYTAEETCLEMSTGDNNLFDISCIKSYYRSFPTSTSAAVTASFTQEDVSTETPGISKTEGSSSTKYTVIVVPTVIGVLLVLATTVVALVYIKRRRLTTETNIHEHDQHQLPELGTEQNEQSIANNEDNVREIPFNEYERLNAYINEGLAGEVYQHLDVDKSEKYQKRNKAKCNAGNQNRHLTKPLKFQESDNDRAQPKAESVKEQDKRQGNGADGGNHELETSATAYERLNLYVNDNLPGYMYEQLDADRTRHNRHKHIPCGGESPGHKTIENELSSAVYTNARVENDELSKVLNIQSPTDITNIKT